MTQAKVKCQNELGTTLILLISSWLVEVRTHISKLERLRVRGGQLHGQHEQPCPGPWMSSPVQAHPQYGIDGWGSGGWVEEPNVVDWVVGVTATISSKLLGQPGMTRRHVASTHCDGL